MDINQYDYRLPKSLVAQSPTLKRSSSRLLVVESGAGYRDIQFENIINELNPGDLLVVNDSRVLPARMFGKKPGGGKVEIMLERIIDDQRALVMLGSNKPIRKGQVLLLDTEHELMLDTEHELTPDTEHESTPEECTLVVSGRQGQFFELLFPKRYNVRDTFERWGCIPLPPYITRDANAFDSHRYQTVYSKTPGAVAAPTAGLHFDQPLIDRLHQRGVAWGVITLHVGAGTFQPVRCQDILAHQMHHERIEVGEQICQQIAQTQAQGGRIIAVGTTVVRALESAAQSGKLTPASLDTDLFIFPGYKFNVVDALITNFHLPKSTLLIMVSAFAGYERIMAAYRYAIDNSYRFYSYGDAMFVQRQP